MTSKSSKDEVRQAAIREREILVGAARTLNDAAAAEDSVLTAEGRPLTSKEWERSYDALGR